MKPSRHRCSVLETAAPDFAWSNAADIAAAVGGGRASAVSIVEATLARIRKRDPVLNSFTAVTEACDVEHVFYREWYAGEWGQSFAACA